MATGTFAPQDLGRLAVVGREDIEAGVILWDRFCVVGRRQDSDHVVSVAVTDLHRVLGDNEAHHRLELHLLEVASAPEQRTRLRRAIAADTRVQPRVLATIETGQRLALISEAPLGNSLDTVQVAIAAEGVIRRAAPLDRRSLLVLAGELALLLSKLHEAEVFGVEFDRHQLRVQRGRFTLDGFEHLLEGSEGGPRADVERLCDLLGELGGEAAAAIRHPVPDSAHELWQRVRSLAGNSALTEDVELPAEPPFVGRERPLQLLGEGLDRARIAQPALVVVRGNRGVGKSRLLREFVAARLAANDAFVLTGTWQPRSAETRGGLLGALDQLARALRGLDIGEREAIRQRINKSIRNLGAVLTKSAPSLGNVLRSIEELPRLELGEDFSRHTATIGDLLRSLGTQKRPLVLVLDNLEVADSSSLAVLRVLAQQRPAHHTLVIAGLRDERKTFSADFEAEFLELEPLTAPDVGRLLARTLPGSIADLEALAEALWAVSDGFPLAVWANLRAWLDRGLLVHGESTWRARRNLRDDVHREPDIRDLFGFRLAGAEDDVRTLALRLAVLGFELTLADARTLGARDSLKSAPAIGPTEVDAALDDLVERGILSRTEHGIRFPHDSIRELVLESAEPEQRRNAHGRVADLLGIREAPAAQIAYHRDLAFNEEQAKPADFDLLSRLHVDAGRERLGVYDLERARWHLERALEYSRDSDQRGIAAEALADTYLLSDDLEGATVLYTALIATAEPERAIAVANKAVHYLYNKSMMNEARQLGELALDRAEEPRPETRIGRYYHTARALLGAILGEPKMPIGLREALVRLYPQLFVTVLISDLSLVVFSAARVLWLYRGLRSGATASARSFVASIWAILGQYHAADRGFAEALEIAISAKDAWGRGVVLHNWAHMSMLPSGRYDQGQRMLDDAVVAFRETGDVSISIMSVLMKSIYGRDREPIDTVIAWVDEGIAMARRHGTEVGLLALESVKLAMLARQGRNDVVPRLLSLSVAIEAEDISPTVRLIARTQLAYAALDAGDEVAAYYQVSTGQAEMLALHAVPEFCQELHAATVFVVLSHKYPNRDERRLLTRALRKLERASRRSPRLAVLGQLFKLKRAVVARDNPRAHALAALLIGSLDRHGNLHAAREAHRALAQSLKAENVLAAAEHERIARNIGRRLGIGSSALNTEFDDPLELGSLRLAMSTSAEAALLDSQSGPIPIDGLVQKGARPKPGAAGSFERDVLQAWALDGGDVPRTRLGDVLEPVRQAVQPSMPDVKLEIRCAEPGLELAASAVDLQLLMINLLMTARDSVAGRSTIELLATQERIRESDGEDVRPGRYLALRVLARGSGDEVPTLGGYGISEGLAVQLGGFLRGSTDRGSVTLIAHLPLEATRERAGGKVLIIHSDEAMRSTVGNALRQLGVEPQEYEPDKFETGHLDGATLVFADGVALRSLRVLEPLLDARLIEVGRRGALATTDERESLRVPFAMSELEALLGVKVH